MCAKRNICPRLAPSDRVGSTNPAPAGSTELITLRDGRHGTDVWPAAGHLRARTTLVAGSPPHGACGLVPRALRDIRAGQAAGRFTVTDAEIALSAVAGGLLGLLRLRDRHQGHMDEASVDQLTEACLRLLGVSASEAARLAASSLPPVGAQ